MRIYLSSEIAARELPSNLHLAKIAASRGHEVWIVEDLTFRWMARLGVFRRGVFHAKSLNFRKDKDAFHNLLVEKSFTLTSMDQEAGIQREDIDNFVEMRFSPTDVRERVSKIFCWGSHDYSALCEAFPEVKEKFVLSGSPRVDYWRRSKDFRVPSEISDLQPYALFSSNFASNRLLPIWQIIGEHYPKNPAGPEISWFSRTQEYLSSFSKELSSLVAFREAIHVLLARNPALNVVVRPHPREDTRAWDYLAEHNERVKVIRQGDLAPWIANSEFLVHSKCTSSLEAYLMGKKSYTVTPKNRNSEEIDLFDSLSAPFPWPSRKDKPTIAKCAPGTDDRVSDRIYVPAQGSCSQIIVGEWEAIHPDRFANSGKARLALIFVVAKLRSALISFKNLQSRLRKSAPYSAKFDYSVDELQKLVNMLVTGAEENENTCDLVVRIFSKQAIMVRAASDH